MVKGVIFAARLHDFGGGGAGEGGGRDALHTTRQAVAAYLESLNNG